MKYKIDFHCHSTSSDGMLTMPELVDLAWERELDALVLTDHCRPYGSYFQNVRVLETLKKIEFPLKVPVILGCEIGTPYAEFLLFGNKAITNWYSYRPKLKQVKDLFGMEGYWDSFWRYVLHGGSMHWGGGTDKDGRALCNRVMGPELPYAMIMCHPACSVDFLNRCPQRMFDCLHGFEVNNGGVDYEMVAPEVVQILREKIKHPRELKNSDCHGTELAKVFNEVDIPDNKELNEGNLIHWLRNKK